MIGRPAVTLVHRGRRRPDGSQLVTVKTADGQVWRGLQLPLPPDQLSLPGLPPPDREAGGRGRWEDRG